MGRHWELMAEYDAETKTFTACAGTVSGASSPYTPTVSGRLKGLRVLPNRDAATSLINAVEFKLSCQSFDAPAIYCAGVGGGLQTAPAFQPVPHDWDVDQEIRAGVPVTIEGRNITADTPVTVTALLYGLLETAGR